MLITSHQPHKASHQPGATAQKWKLRACNLGHINSHQVTPSRANCCWLVSNTVKNDFQKQISRGGLLQKSFN